MTYQSYPGGDYAAMPQQPGGPAVRPSTVTNAAYLMFVHAALVVISAVIGASYPQATSAAATVVGAVVGAAIYVGLALMVLKGANWARIVTWVLLGLSIFFNLLGQLVTVPLTLRLISIAIIVVDIAIAVLLAQRPSSAYFSGRGR